MPSVRDEPELEDLEVILVDDCSRDQSREVLAQAAQVDPRIRVFANKQNLGPVRTRNRGLGGLAKATVRFVHFTDADDILPQAALKTLLTLATHQCCDNVRGGDLVALSSRADFRLPESTRIRCDAHSRPCKD